MKLLMLQGLPASGKTTYATELCKEQNWKRVNRDLIRSMLHFDKWSGKNEDTTVRMEKVLVMSLLSSGFNVVVDDCNLNPKNKEMWKQVAKDSDATFSTKAFLTPYEECVERDAEREKHVGDYVIRNMAFQYDLEGIPKKNIVICDIDGTIADTSHRTHFLTDDPKVKNWKGFFSQMMNDPVRDDVKEVLNKLHAEGSVIVYVSGRPDTYRDFTQSWLDGNGVLFTPFIFMRKEGDSREDTIIKTEIFNTYFKNKEIVEVIDDRPSVIRMWKEKGLNVRDVGAGVEF